MSRVNMVLLATSGFAMLTFAQADTYYDRTKQFWDQVRDEWSQIFVKQGEVTLKGPVDKLGLFWPCSRRRMT